MFPAYLSKPTAKTNGLRSNHRLLQVQVIQCEGFKVRSYNVFSHASVYVSLQFSEMGSHCRCPLQFDCLCSRGEEDDRLGVMVRERAVQDRPKLFHKGRGAAPSLGAPHIPKVTLSTEKMHSTVQRTLRRPFYKKLSSSRLTAQDCTNQLVSEVYCK